MELHLAPSVRIRRSRDSVVPASGTTRPAPSEPPLIQLQKAFGNHVFGHIVQAKLKLGQPDDAHEQEAERVAGQVMRIPAVGEGMRVQRQCAECDREIHRRAVADSRESSARSSILNEGSLTDGGSPLPTSVRGFFEPRFEHDFSSVRVHTGSVSERANDGLASQAFTYGNHIWFGREQSVEPTPLLAHELVHVVQSQRAPAYSPLRRSVESDARRIEGLLSYGLFDWAITDNDAIEALEILSNLPTDLQRDVLRRIDLERLRENLPVTHMPILERILAAAGPPPANVRETVSRIQDLLSYGLFDWAITDNDAREAFRLLTSLPPNEQQRVILVIDYQRLLDNLPDARDRERLRAIRGPAAVHESAELSAMDALRVRARNIITRLKEAADRMTLPAPPASGSFESFLAREYLLNYCAQPSSATASAAIDQMVLEGAGGFTHYGFGLLRGLAERAQAAGVGYIDSPSLLGIPAPGAFTTTGAFDPWSQGPNPTQMMHFAAGIKWSWAPMFLVHWYFVHYEDVSQEGWQLFGLDSLNDIIAEEGGRLLAEDLKAGRACRGGGMIDLDPYFAGGRRFLRAELQESRLDTLAMRVHLQNLVVATGAAGGGVLSQPLYSMTIMEQLMAGASDADVLVSPDARILTLLYHLLRRG